RREARRGVGAGGARCHRRRECRRPPRSIPIEQTTAQAAPHPSVAARRTPSPRERGEGGTREAGGGGAGDQWRRGRGHIPRPHRGRGCRAAGEVPWRGGGGCPPDALWPPFRGGA